MERLIPVLLIVCPDIEAVPVTSNSVETDAFEKVQSPVIDSLADLDAGPVA